MVRYRIGRGTHANRRRVAAGMFQRAWRRRRPRNTIQKLKKDVRILKKSTQYKHLHTYNNFPSVHSAIDNQPAFVFTELYGAHATGIPANVPKAAYRENNKVLLNSVTARLQFYPDNSARANYYDIRVMLIKVPDTRNISNADNFELQNFLTILDANVGYCYTNAPKRSILNQPALGATDGITAYQVLTEKVVRMHSVLATANNSAANNNSPVRCTLYYKWPKGLETAYSTDQEDSCYKNNVILHVVPSNVGAVPAAPSMDMLSTIRWQET